tara:strand:- start:3642 stop:3899 length:258 start_codon:yes stop_codon:yes gene_type:complete
MSKRTINVEVKPRYPNEPLTGMIKRFIKKVKKERLIEKAIERQRYEKPSVNKKREKEKRKIIMRKLMEKKNPSNTSNTKKGKGNK